MYSPNCWCGSYEVPYSEHCSFTELKEFVQAVAPKNIIPSVVSSAGQPADVMVAALLNKEPLPTVDPKEATEQPEWWLLDESDIRWKAWLHPLSQQL